MSEVEKLKTRVAELEAQNAILRDEAELRRRRPRFIAGTRVTMPTDAELLELSGVVLAAFPVLQRAAARPDVFDREFRNSFIGIATLPRRADGKLDHQFAAVTWIDRSADALQRMGLGTDQSLCSLTAAALAHGDVAYSPLDRFPHDLEFGFGNYHGAPAGDAWREVLAPRRLRAPTPLARARAIVAPSPATVRVFG
jgi:hypothetical protein